MWFFVCVCFFLSFISSSVPILLQLEVRKLATGDIVFTRQNLASACAALFTSEYLRDGRQLLLVLSSSGDLLAFQQVSTHATLKT